LTITAGNGITYPDFNLKDLFFINTTPGSNTTIELVGILMTPGRKEELGV